MYKISVLNAYGRYENPVIRIMLYENFVIRIRLYVNFDICIMLYVSCNCGPLQVFISVICFPLSYKLSTSVSSVQVLKRTSEAFRIQQGEHSNRSPPDVGFDFWFWNVNVKAFVISQHFYWQIVGFQVHAQVLITSWVVIAILLGSATLVVRNPQTIPTDNQNFFEYVLEFIRDVSKTQIGEEYGFLVSCGVCVSTSK